MGGLYPIISYQEKYISKKTKVCIFISKLKSILLYVCETWRLTKQITDMLQRFINRCLRRIINIKWPESNSNEDLWTVTNQQPIYIQIKKRKWNWIGHTLRKPTGAVEKTELDWNPQGARRCGRSRKTWKKTVKEEAREAGKTYEVKTLATNRTGWRSFTEALCSGRRYRN
jgi:hypothetical protein